MQKGKAKEMKILIAEDNQMTQMLRRTIMRGWGYDFDMASDGLEAVEYAQKNEGKYDLCLMDVEMPKMSGIEATKIIRKTVNYFPILAFTSNANYENACYEAGMDDFITKHYPNDALLEKIKELSVKLYIFTSKSDGFDITEAMPADKLQAEELRELARQNLCKINIRGTGERDLTVIAHKNVPYKISNDFVANGDEFSVFLDRSPDRSAECHLYKTSRPMQSIILKDNNFMEKQKAEDALLKDYRTMIIKNNKA